VHKAAELLSLHIEAFFEGKSQQSILKFEQLNDPDALASGPLDSPVLLDWCHLA
jgi:hypothetical protein